MQWFTTVHPPPSSAPLVMILDQLYLGYHGASYIRDDLYQQVYSCGSLVPKIRGGCMDSHYHKPWEKSEGEGV